MARYHAFSDDFYLNMNLNTELDLPQNRETVLHFFEQVRKQFPSMKNFYNRDRQELVLEEDKEQGSYRWTSIEAKRVSSGYVNPASGEQAVKQHAFVLDLIPYALSVSPLDCESLNVMFGFDFTFRGNHNELLADALGMIPAFERMTDIPGVSVLCHEPSIQLAFDEACRIQGRVGFETRTSPFHVRTGDFPEDQLSVYLTLRRYGSLDDEKSYSEAMLKLYRLGKQLVESYLVDGVLRPLKEAIALR